VRAGTAVPPEIPSPRPRGASSLRRLARASLGVALAALVAVLGSVLWHRIALVQQGAVLPEIPQGMVHDPAARARGAVLSISGERSQPVATYDPASGTLYVRFQSRYYDPRHTASLNREYLATEGRLVVQLVLYDVPEVPHVVAELYHGRERLATVTGSAGEDYYAYRVQYARGLP
jgi:hypothetical protein